MQNTEDTFALYPKYGATLQDWRFHGRPLIAHPLPALLQKGLAPPGGYRSYLAVGGFRPICSIGSHQNPCIVVWNFPFEWIVREQTCDRICLELTPSFYHADIFYRISVQKGKPGFCYEARAVNKLPGISYGAFNFNLILSLSLDEVLATRFLWKGHDQALHTSISENRECFFKIPSAHLDLTTPRWSLSLGTDANETEGFFVDWLTNYITPELHGEYRKMAKNDTANAHWTFAVHNSEE